MDLSGKMERQIKIKSDGDMFHEIFRTKPHHISNICTDKVQGVGLHEGDWGTIGSIIIWNYVHDGKEKIAKELIEAIDEEKRSVTFKVIEGNIIELYKSFIIIVHVDTKGESNLVTWTFEYEKLKEDVPDPDTLMDFCINVKSSLWIGGAAK
ncbi:kirola-like [Cornus florida]|uniref:kirola-like n=1 Tax=Cornus florida TaxID=4283 RepID=UPI002896B950|nr:kirola-like [Cornus florida]